MLTAPTSLKRYFYELIGCNWKPESYWTFLTARQVEEVQNLPLMGTSKRVERARKYWEAASQDEALVLDRVRIIIARGRAMES